MKKKHVRIFAIVVGILFLLVLVANIGVNFWLKNRLPGYIKNNSAYLVTYKTLNVDVGTGNIFSTGITIHSKDPDNHEVLGLQGTVDTLSISRLGIYDALFNNNLNTKNLLLAHPRLKITLPKPTTDKTKKKRNPLAVENIRINNGNIQVFRYNKQKFFSGTDLNLTIEGLELTKKNAQKKMPFSWEHYKLNGKNFYYRPDNIYAFTAKNVTTTEGQMKIKAFAMVPLLSYQNFKRFYPKERNLFDFQAAEIDFKDVVLKDKNIALSKVRVERPNLKMFTTDVRPAEKEQSFAYDVDLEDVLFNDAKINIVNPNGSPKFSAGNLTMNISQFLMNEETAKGNIPFQYSDFQIKGSDINYVSPTQNVVVASLALNQKSADLKNISVQPTASASAKTLLDLTAKNINLQVNKWGFVENKLQLNVQNLFVDGLNGKIATAENVQKKKTDFRGISFPLLIKNINLKNSNLVYDKGNQPMVFKDLNANFQNVEMNASTVKDALPFKTVYYSLTTRNFLYKTKFYDLSAALLKLNKKNMQVSNFAMLPTVSRAEFIRMIPTEKDLYTIKAKKIDMNGSWDLVSNNKFLNASDVILDGVDANIFRSKIPADDLTEKPLYSRLLRSIKFPVFVNSLDLKNSVLVYEEDTKKSDGPGKLTFTNFNLTAKNLNSGKMKGKPTQVPINITCLFMDASPMKVNWTFNTLNPSDEFAISGRVGDLPASRINPFIVPYLKIQATGLISELVFDFNGNYSGIHGKLNLKHEELKIGVLKETGEENKLLSAVANIFVKTDSGSFPESVTVEDVDRDKTKSFFNLLWRGIEQGLKKTLIGINAPKTEETIRNTVENTKSALEENKKDLQETQTEVKEKVENIKEKAQATKDEVKEKRFFRKVFKKKSEK